MISREGEPTRFLDIPRISQKTSAETLQRWDKEGWLIEGRNGVAKDIVKNVRELRIVSEPELNGILESIRYYKPSSIYTGEDAIAVDSAPIIGRLGALANWPMHAPQMVYLSARCVGAMEGSGDEPEALRRKMRTGAINYAKEHLPSPGLYIEILDFLLRNNKRRFLFRDLVPLLREGNVEGAHGLVNARRSPAGRRGEVIRCQ